MINNNFPIVFLGTLIAAAPAFAQEQPDDPAKQQRPGSEPRQQGSQPPGSQRPGSEQQQQQQQQQGSRQMGGPHGQGAYGAERGMHGLGMLVMGAETDIPDAELAMIIHQYNQHEIDVASLASERASSAQVRSFAKQIEADHEKANKALTQLAEKKGWELTATGGAGVGGGIGATGEAGTTGGTASKDVTWSGMQKMHGQKVMEHLQPLTGAEFDRHFLLVMQKEHADAIALLTAQTYLHPIDRELGAEVRRLIPTLEKHRSRAISLLEKEGQRSAEQATR